jgi:hypothetical protein
MTNQELEVFVHGEGSKPKVITASRGEILRDVLIRAEFIREGEDEVFVFLGECEEALNEGDEIEDGADRHAPVDVLVSLEVLEIEHHHHIHCHRCRHVAVGVNFLGQTKRHKFSPSTTVGVVSRWARNKFHLDSALADEFVLHICDTAEQPRSDKHLGELVNAGHCEICFDLIKEITPQG